MVSQKQEAKALTPGHRVQEHVLSHGRLFGTPWTVARQAPLSMGFSRQEHWSGLPLPSLEDKIARSMQSQEESPPQKCCFIKHIWCFSPLRQISY